jgi:sugar-specific transcriptional regulator TrmB
MTVQEGDIRTLVDLGLTISQAKVYLTLVAYGKTKGRTIYKYSGVARQDIYRVLEDLQEKGLVEKIIVTPTEYKATPIKQGLANLLRQKAIQYKIFEEKIKQLQEKFQAHNGEKASEEYQFSLIPEKDAAIQKFKTAFDDTQKTVEGIFFWRGFSEMMSSRDKGWEKALGRGVRLRFILHDYEEEKNKHTLTAIQKLTKKGAFEVRYASASPPASMSIFDREKILITTSPVPFPADCSSLWLKNPGLAGVVGHYFDLLWVNAAENPK